MQTRANTGSECLRGNAPDSGRLRIHFSSATDEWATPQWLFDNLTVEFAFTLDPCATSQNAKCSAYFTRSENGLIQNWVDHTVFMNPPYGRAIGQWLKKAYESRTPDIEKAISHDLLGFCAWSSAMQCGPKPVRFFDALE
jgi:hypothetical protein